MVDGADVIFGLVGRLDNLCRRQPDDSRVPDDFTSRLVKTGRQKMMARIAQPFTMLAIT